MINEPKVSKKTLAMLDAAKKEARKRVIKRGLLQFRADEKLVGQVLEIADYKKIPVSILIRSWVAEHVREEIDKLGHKSKSAAVNKHAKLMNRC